ncbi:MAG: acetyl-CoA carboxylase carboxyltransferase subunit alpha [Alphaproteobacteria bacterium]|nr:acetyl-CoA carboxylase carboxyltransferase subunit alpha [Alphaproteobacteria bacterium]
MSDTATSTLDFEKTINEVEERIKQLKDLEVSDDVKFDTEIARLRSKLERLLKNAYAKLSPWQKTQVARHAQRPHTIDYINGLIEDFEPLSGDRAFGDDEALIGGLGRFRGQPVVVMGQEKGHDLETRVKHNFGMAKPEGYRKAQRLMDMADKFGLPVLAFVDTSGAFPGVDAEERGQAQAIASSIERCLNLKVPFVSTVIGEGGSGGAIAIAVANRILMLEHSIYSVISPEGCASILWRSPDKVKEATEALCLTAQDLRRLGIIDEIIPEPVGGAHRNKKEMIERAGDVIAKHLKELAAFGGDELKKKRTEKFMKMGRKFAKPE